MSEFYASGDFRDRKNFFTQYYSIMSCISLRAFTVDAVMNRLKKYSGFGIETQIANLNKCVTQLKDYKEDVRTEFYSLVRIVDIINDYENRANGILGESSSNLNEFVLAQPEPLTKTLSHSDIGKLKSQLKYYTQEAEVYKKMYDYFCKKYDENTSINLTDSEYATLKNMFLLMNNYVNYEYSNVEYFKDNKKGDVSSDFDAKITYDSLSDKGIKDSLSFNVLNANGSYGFTSMKITAAQKVGNDYVTNIITLSNIKLEGNADIASIDISEIIEKAKKGKLSFKDVKDIFEPLGISLSGNGSCFKATSTITKHIVNVVSYYNEAIYTIGEVNFEAGANLSGAKGKVGYSLASVESKQGIITNSGKYDFGAKARAGGEVGFEWGKKAEVSAGLFSLSLEADDGFDYYIWE